MTINTLLQKINDLKTAFVKALERAATNEQLEKVRIEFLGRNGSIAQLMESLKNLSVEEKRVYGPALNELKKDTTFAFENKLKVLSEVEQEYAALKEKNFDVTAYLPHQLTGTLHPYTYIIKEIEDIFISMGFEVVDGPEIETDFYNFTALNIPADHPARDMHDTFWLDVPGLLMRTHTSTVQVHALETKKPPIAVLAPGRCYRHEATDATHDFMFMQAEIAVVDKNISMANLIAVGQTFLRTLFDKKDLKIMLRPSYYPFVEPGVDIAMSCPFCKKGCSVCKKTTWIEMAGAGLIHPNVLQSCGIDATVYSGFAFGFGLTRLTMFKYGINDIRLLHSGKLEFLSQF